MKQYIAIEELLDIPQQEKRAENSKTQQPELTTQERDLQARLNINRTEILKEKAEKRGVTLETQLRNDAIWMLGQRSDKN